MRRNRTGGDRVNDPLKWIISVVLLVEIVIITIRYGGKTR